MLGSDGYDAIAPDWIGHGDSDKPEGFDCSAEAYIKAMEQFVQAVDIKRPFALVVHVSAAHLRLEVGTWICAEGDGAADLQLWMQSQSRWLSIAHSHSCMQRTGCLRKQTNYLVAMLRDICMLSCPCAQ